MKKIGTITSIVLVILAAAQNLNHLALAADAGQQASLMAQDSNIAYTRGHLFPDNDNFSPTANLAMPITGTSAHVPTPVIMFLLGIGMLGLASFRRRFKG